MNIELNGTREQIGGDCTASMLIEQLDLTGKRIAIEVNGDIVPRSQHREYRFSDGDRVEIVHAVGGG